MNKLFVITGVLLLTLISGCSKIYPDEYTVVRDESGKVMYRFHTISRNTIAIQEYGNKRVLVLPKQNGSAVRRIYLKPGWSVMQYKDLDAMKEEYKRGQCR